MLVIVVMVVEWGMWAEREREEKTEWSKVKNWEVMHHEYLRHLLATAVCVCLCVCAGKS